MNTIRKPVAAILAFGAALAMPMAFAQDPTTTGEEPTSSAGQLTWADLDTNGDGNIGREEAAAHPALAGVFDQADADSDGQLTADEYRTFAASQGAGTTGDE